MRVRNRKWNTVGRKVFAWLLLCGILLPMFVQTNAATVTYRYKWIKDNAGLPTDDGWHDYFLAWEDLDNKNKVWFTDYHWYTPDGDNNIDEGGSSWMEYRSASTLPDSKSEEFSSQDSLGHMQIKYAGKDGENGNAPMYYIRVSKMNGGYSYFTAKEPTNNEKEADQFTFEDHGDVYHIFVNISGGIDRYLTRNDEYLETTYSSSAGGGEKYRPLRVYQRSFTVSEEDELAEGEVTGKVDVYECYRIKTVNDLMALAQKSKGWQDILIAWDDARINSDGSHSSDKNTVWYTNGIWYDNEKPNYLNDYSGSRYAYWSNKTLGEGYTTATSDTFILPEKVGHFQIKYVDRDSDNMLPDSSYDAPRFHIRFALNEKQYFYLGEKEFETDSSKADKYTFMLYSKGENAGYTHIFSNWSWAEDECLARNGNRLSLQEHNNSDEWQYNLRVYAYRTVQYEGIVKSFTIGKGTTYSIEDQIVLNEGVTITVEDGGVLMVDKKLLNNGQILVKQGGTVIVNEGGCIMPFKESADSKITLDGGNLIIMDNAQVLCDTNKAQLLTSKGSTIVNRGLLMVGKVLELRNSSSLKNEASGFLVLGGRISRERGIPITFTASNVAGHVTNGAFTLLCSTKSKLYNYGVVSVPRTVNSDWGSDSFIDYGQLQKR